MCMYFFPIKGVCLFESLAFRSYTGNLEALSKCIVHWTQLVLESKHYLRCPSRYVKVVEVVYPLTENGLGIKSTLSGCGGESEA